MSDNIAISVQGVSKAYRIWNSPASRLISPALKHLGNLLLPDSGVANKMRSRADRHYRDFWALKDISFEVKKGESVGIIGRNGSGKSTLLQIIAGTLQPTTGSVKINGRIAALLELGSGFNPEFTGRENIYLSGSILGLSRSEVDAKFPDIVRFSDIGDFIEQPVKTYSSGMMMRLAFALNTSVNANILIVDEALAVGDAPFQAKCFAKMRALQKEGVTLILVSHDINAVSTLTEKAIYLRQGSLVANGDAKEICRIYELNCLKEQGIVISDSRPATHHKVSAHDLPLNPEFNKNANNERQGTFKIKIIDFVFLNTNGAPEKILSWDLPAYIHLRLEAHEDIHGDLSIGFLVKDLKGKEIIGGTDKEKPHLVSLKKGDRVHVRATVPLSLRADQYYMSATVYLFNPEKKFTQGVINFAEAELMDLVEYAYFFQVTWHRPWAHYPPVFQRIDYSIEHLAIK